jgi:hypothetical protein
MDQDILSVRIQLCILGIGLGSAIALIVAALLVSGISLPVLGTALLVSIVGIVFGVAGLRQWLRTIHRPAKPMERWGYWLSPASCIGLSLVVTACVWWYLLSGVLHPAIGPLVRIEDLTAAPFALGTAALEVMQGARPRADTLRRRLAAKARALGTGGKNPVFGYGLVQADAACGAVTSAESAKTIPRQAEPGL